MRDLPHLLREAELELAEADGTLYVPGSSNDTSRSPVSSGWRQCGVTWSPVSDQSWGLLTAITLPGGVELGLYQPRHPTAAQPS